MRTFYLTTPIYYPNARPHVGSAYTTIVCDVIARYKRMCGYDVAFLTGTDEHGEKLQRAAETEGVTPQEFVAEKRKLFIGLWEKLGIPDSVYPQGRPGTLRFIYTDHPDHTASVQRLLLRAREHGFVDKRRYEGRYCVSDERYISEGTNPVICDICGRPAELISEENYFFKLSEFQEKLLRLYDEHPDFVRPDYRMNEVKSFVRSGLRDISVSRKRLKWGIPWPDDPEQVFYVWYDALTSYMTGIGYAQGEAGNDEFRKYWRNRPGESELVHMIGKDILRFHAVYWPAFLMAAYPDQPGMLPTRVFAHGWIYYEQDKMSKSKGNVVYPEPIVDAFDGFGAPGNDALRYYLLRDTPFGQDASFSYEGLIQRYNSDLANDLGNLASRTLTMLRQYCGGAVPAPDSGSEARARKEAGQLTGVCREAFDRLDFSSVLSAVWAYVSEANKLIVERRPWELAKSSAPADQELLKGTLYSVTQTLLTACRILYPVLPASAERLWQQLGQTGQIVEECLEAGGDESAARLIAPGTAIGSAAPIFPRLDKAAALARLEDLAEADRKGNKPASAGKPKGATVTESPEEKSPTAKPEPAAPTPAPAGAEAAPAAAPEAEKFSIDVFAKVEMRVGVVVSAERIPKADKLLKIMVDIGSEVRQVLAGIAQYYEPEKLVGRKVVVVTNLKPRKMRGLESNGMIVAAAAGEEGRPVLVTFTEDVPKGARLR